MNVFDVMLYFVFCGMNSNITYIIQLLIILGYFHIYISKWFIALYFNSSSMAS